MKLWQRIGLAIILCILGLWLTINRPDPGTWTGTPETSPVITPSMP